MPIIILTIFSGFLIYHQDFTVCKGLYTIGESPDGPVITDTRFNIIKADRDTGVTLLNQGKIDLYLSSQEIRGRKDTRSQYAIGALKKYLEKQELSQIASRYDVDKAFPLRVQITYLKSQEDKDQSLAEAAPEGTIADISENRGKSGVWYR